MAEQPSSLKITESEGVTLVGFRDASILDAVTTQGIGRELYGLVESGNHPKVVLDFANVRFLSSQTLGVLLTLRRKADKAKVKVALACIRPELHRVFEITNLDKLFGFFGTTEDAVADLSAG
ncbi:MAG: STAS domain-containing protein [Planctomycetes bacterium]|nr:STAS domain-containing protein [Planctomycetota bacterium]